LNIKGFGIINEFIYDSNTKGYSMEEEEKASHKENKKEYCFLHSFRSFLEKRKKSFSVLFRKHYVWWEGEAQREKA
jgi:hypothetical protein